MTKIPKAKIDKVVGERSSEIGAYLDFGIWILEFGI
jgi:hypothetical protein